MTLDPLIHLASINLCENIDHIIEGNRLNEANQPLAAYFLEGHASQMQQSDIIQADEVLRQNYLAGHDGFLVAGVDTCNHAVRRRHKPWVRIRSDCEVQTNAVEHEVGLVLRNEVPERFLGPDLAGGIDVFGVGTREPPARSQRLLGPRSRSRMLG